MVGRNFSHSPKITIENKGFENFGRKNSRSKIYPAEILVRSQKCSELFWAVGDPVGAACSPGRQMTTIQQIFTSSCKRNVYYCMYTFDTSFLDIYLSNINKTKMRRNWNLLNKKLKDTAAGSK